MKKNAGFLIAVSLFVIFVVAGIPGTCDADPGTESSEADGPDVALRREAPVYTGPYEEGDLVELSVEDFEEFGTEPESPQDQYRQYQKMLKEASPGILVPYRLRIVDRDLTREDFLGVDIPEDLSDARYSGYLDMIPDTANGRTVHYVYVYHRSLARIGDEPQKGIRG